MKRRRALCDVSQALLSFCAAHRWARAGPVQSFNLVLRGAISFQSKAHKLPQSTRQVLINIQTFAFKRSPIYSSFPSICETRQSHTGLLFVGGPRGEEYYGGYYGRLPVRLGSRRNYAHRHTGTRRSRGLQQRVNIELVLVARLLMTDIVARFLICRLIPISNIWRHSLVSFAP